MFVRNRFEDDIGFGFFRPLELCFHVVVLEPSTNYNILLPILIDGGALDGVSIRKEMKRSLTERGRSK